MAVHVNHLNRALEETTGHPTTALIICRVAQEAKMLLRQTNWAASEITSNLGFADVAHFCNLFKLQTGPGHSVAGARYHGVADESVPMRDLAVVISRQLSLPVVSKSPGEAADHFG